jgi:hypothetical protein
MELGAIASVKQRGDQFERTATVRAPEDGEGGMEHMKI